jgi:hypothetical protein
MAAVAASPEYDDEDDTITKTLSTGWIFFTSRLRVVYSAR